MNAAQQKIIQYLSEARASEDALTRVLESQIAMTPQGSYRSILEQHLEETRRHATRVGERLAQVDGAANPLLAVVGFWEEMIGQTVALGKAPLDFLRGSGGEEKLLKNAKDICATEALEIATYAALEQLARAVDDPQTARLAASIRDEEQRMLDRVLGEIPKLTDAVVGAEVNGNPTYDLETTGAADSARKVPGVAEAKGQIKAAVNGDVELAISGYDGLSVEQIASKLSELSQEQVSAIEAYERSHKNRTAVLRAAHREPAT